MAKTALDLTVEELRSYHPDRNFGDSQSAERRELALELARTIAHLLRERFGIERVVAFGSLAHCEWFTRWSDIDLAAWGIPVDRFYKAVAVVTGISREFRVNLVAPESCSPSLQQSIEREGIDL